MNGSSTAPETAAGCADPLAYFGGMIDHCYDYAEAARNQGRPIVGITCEFTPREILLAAGAVPVCLCGGSAETIPAAEHFLPANVCPLVKSTFGYHVTGTNPFLKWADLVVGETTCDGKKKMFELLGGACPMYVLELPQKPDDPDSFERWVKELVNFKTRLEELFKVEITDAKLREAIRLMNRERGLRRQLAGLMVADPPPLTGRQLIEFRSIISGIEADLAQYARAIELYGGGCPAHVARASLPASSGTKTDDACHSADARLAASAETRSRRDAVRVLLTGVPLVHGAERVLELIESCGAVVVCMENCTGLKPILEDVDEKAADPIRALAAKYYHLPCSVMTPNNRRFESLRQLAAEFRPQCIIELVWQACLTYDIESCQVRKLAEETLRLPHLKITTDYSPSDSARIVSRVQALVEMVQARV